MLNRTTPGKFIAPRRQERKERNISPKLARFAYLREVFFFESAIRIQPTFSNILWKSEPLLQDSITQHSIAFCRWTQHQTQDRWGKQSTTKNGKEGRSRL
jgi:hypothetical protein